MTAPQVAETAWRVSDSSSEEANRRISVLTEATVLHYARRREQIAGRLRELEQEWDIERTLQTNAGVVMSVLYAIGLVRKPVKLLPMVAAFFMFTHATSGWCPPVPVMRRLGVRTMREIDRERFALKALRGDFDDVGPSASGTPAEKAKRAVEAVSAWPLPAPSVVPGFEQLLNVP